MTDDMRRNVFAQALENDRKSKVAAERGIALTASHDPVFETSGKHAAPSKSDPSSVQRKPPKDKKNTGREQANITIDSDLRSALKLARILRRKSMSEICDEALRLYLKDEIAMVREHGGM